MNKIKILYRPSWVAKGNIPYYFSFSFSGGSYTLHYDSYINFMNHLFDCLPLQYY